MIELNVTPEDFNTLTVDDVLNLQKRGIAEKVEIVSRFVSDGEGGTLSQAEGRKVIGALPFVQLGEVMGAFTAAIFETAAPKATGG